jgi:hypothetical protein
MQAPEPAAVPRAPRTPRWATLALVCLGLPLGSWIVDGRGRLAFTMYSSTISYRLEMAWLDDGGRRHALPPTAVAENVSFDSAAPFLAGAEVFRTVPQIDALRAHLRDIARAGCAERRAMAVEIVLHERPSEGQASDLGAAAADSPTTERVACARSE